MHRLRQVKTPCHAEHELAAQTVALSPHADYQIGRLIDAVSDSGQLDNTMTIFIMGDNGASAEGSLQGTSNEVGWEWVGIADCG